GQPGRRQADAPRSRSGNAARHARPLIRRMIDSHCHLADQAFVADLDAVVSRAKDAGVASALCILSSDEPEEIARIARVREAWPESQFAGAVHPHRSKPYGGHAPDAAALTRETARTSGARASGAMG